MFYASQDKAAFDILRNSAAYLDGAIPDHCRNAVLNDAVLLKPMESAVSVTLVPDFSWLAALPKRRSAMYREGDIPKAVLKVRWK